MRWIFLRSGGLPVFTPVVPDSERGMRRVAEGDAHRAQDVATGRSVMRAIGEPLEETRAYCRINLHSSKGHGHPRLARFVQQLVLCGILQSVETLPHRQ